MVYRRAGSASLFTLLLATAAAGPASQPATQPVDLARWLEEAGSLQPDVREAARINLFGLLPDDLPALRAAAKANGPLTAAQIDMLRQAVVYVYTRATMLQEASTGKAVMGVMLSVVDRFAPADVPDDQGTIGVTVVNRLPGFVAARYLQDGDLILAFEFDGQMHWFESRQSLQNFVSKLQINATITALVRRGGRDLKISFPLDSGRVPPDPAVADNGRVLQLLAADAESSAIQRMEAEFADVLGGKSD